ncbi:MAG: hypothetical protein HYS12_10680 [Planctomycetes bacterium]|nr:hypothetical protein [Planctomycetota bacterium]
MFLVEDQRFGTTHLIFTWKNPRQDGYTGNVIDDVGLDYNMEEVHSWPDGHDRPEVCVGRAPDNPKHYKVFKYLRDREAAGYQPVTGTPDVFGSWSDYLKLWHPEDLPDEDWFESLEVFDKASRERRQRSEMPASPTGTDRDEVAAWLAKTHFLADTGLREIWYLPQGAPPDELRFLEVNERLGSESKVEPIDFGLEVGGTHFLLFVADITGDQLAQIKQDPSRLPPGWSLSGARNWRRRRA